jgi:hypothetical protein
MKIKYSFSPVLVNHLLSDGLKIGDAANYLTVGDEVKSPNDFWQKKIASTLARVAELSGGEISFEATDDPSEAGVLNFVMGKEYYEAGQRFYRNLIPSPDLSATQTRVLVIPDKMEESFSDIFAPEVESFISSQLLEGAQYLVGYDIGINDEMLRGMIDSKTFARNSSGPVVIDYSSGAAEAGRRIAAGDEFCIDEFCLNATSVDGAIKPCEEMQTHIEEAFKRWEEASGGLIKFRKVEGLSDARGIELVSCATYDELGSIVGYANLREGFSLVCLMNDFERQSAFFAEKSPEDLQGFLRFVRNTITHEIGHAIGLKHPHEIDAIKERLERMGSHAASASVMDYDARTDEYFKKCLEEYGVNLCVLREDIKPAPGPIDERAIKLAYESAKEKIPVAESTYDGFMDAAKTGIRNLSIHGFMYNFFQDVGYPKDHAALIAEGAVAATIAVASPMGAALYIAANHVQIPQRVRPYFSGILSAVPLAIESYQEGSVFSAASRFAGSVAGSVVGSLAGKLTGAAGRSLAKQLKLDLEDEGR